MKLPFNTIYFSFLTFLILLTFLFIPKNIAFAQELCEGYTSGCTDSSECGSCPNGAGCSCIGLQLREIIDCPTCNPCKNCISACVFISGYGDACTCTPCRTYKCLVPGRCTCPASCYNYTCVKWTPWSACSSTGWRYATCMDYLSPYIIIWDFCGTSGGGGNTPPDVSCSVNLIPNDVNFSLNTNSVFNAQLSNVVGPVQKVNFSSSAIDKMTVNPTSDSSSPYTTIATGVSPGDVTLYADVIMDNKVTCSDSSSGFIGLPGPWWQTKDADILSKGILSSDIPLTCTLLLCNPFFDLDGEGNYPGIPISSLEAYFGTAEVSSKNWVSTTNIITKLYSFSSFYKKVPLETNIVNIDTSSIEGSYLLDNKGTASEGAYWFYYDGSETNLDLDINSDINIGPNRIILFVNSSNLNINGKINLDNGEGLLLVIVGKSNDNTKGNINIGSNVGGNYDNLFDLEGLFFAEGQINTGEFDTNFSVRGTLASLTEISLQRDMGDTNNPTTPSEFIEYAPDLLFLIPPSLRSQKISWKEIEP